MFQLLLTFLQSTDNPWARVRSGSPVAVGSEPKSVPRKYPQIIQHHYSINSGIDGCFVIFCNSMIEGFKA